MQESTYSMIFKRKSFHIFKEILSISNEEVQEIYDVYRTLLPLVSDIQTEIRIVKSEETSCKRGAEYCILLYSEKKEQYLQNIGYLGEQLDLYLASKNIGALWFGIGKVEEPSYHGLDFMIMIAIAKMPENTFRKNMFKSKRKPLEEIWVGNQYLQIANIVRFSPSACNTQPWIVEEHEKQLWVYRYKKPGKRGIMPIDKVAHYNRIDMGIFLCFMDICLQHENIAFTKELFVDAVDDAEKVLVAKYEIS